MTDRTTETTTVGLLSGEPLADFRAAVVAAYAAADAASAELVEGGADLAAVESFAARAADVHARMVSLLGRVRDVRAMRSAPTLAPEARLVYETTRERETRITAAIEEGAHEGRVYGDGERGGGWQ